MSERLLDLLGLMRKAGAVQIGEMNSGTACREGKAKLLLLAKDASENAVKRAESFVFGRRTLLMTLPYTKDEIAEKLGSGVCAMAAVTDLGFANAFVSKLSAQYPGQYEDTASALSKKLEKTDRRKKAAASEKNRKKRERED